MKIRFLAFALAAFPNLGTAAELKDVMKEYVIAEIMPWTKDPALLAAIEAANAANGGLSVEAIAKLDEAWKAEVGTATEPLVDAVVDSAASEALRARMAETGGRVTEVIVMDSKGLNVAASGATSDYWQGDEDKYLQTYALGADAIHVSDVELDDSTQTYQAQVSVTVVDAAGKPAGAITIGLNADLF